MRLSSRRHSHLEAWWIQIEMRVRVTSRMLRRRGWLAVLALAALLGPAWLLWQPQPAAVEGSQEAASACAAGSAIASPADHPELVADCDALLEAKDQLRGAAALNWSADLALASWTGVTVSGSPRRVTSLRLANRQLSGTIPPELGDLSQLQLLDLGRNRLSGAIPPELGDLAELTFLLLESNRLSGALPAALGDLWKLEVLYLDDNRLSGAIPHWLDDLPLTALTLSGNSGWTGCLPAELTGFDDDDLGDLSLSRCAALPRRALTVRLDSPARGGEILPRVGVHRYRQGARVLLRARPSFDREVAAWSGACSGDAETCVVTMDADQTVGVSFQEIVHQLTVEPAEGGAITPDGVTTRSDGESVSLSVSWNDATHTFAGWTGACSEAGTATTCTLEMTEDRTVGAEFSALPADRCSTPTASDCIRAVYLGAPDDYAQVQEIPADKLLTPDPDGRYQVERGQQYTVVTAAPLPTGWTRFYLERRQAQGTISATSAMRLIPPVGTTYTFTVTADERGPHRIPFDLHAARPLPVQRPGIKPELGAVVVTVEFIMPTLTYNRLDTTGAASAAGSYAFLQTAGDQSTAIENFGLLPARGVELRIHANDESGASRIAFYDIIEVGDTLDYQTNGLDCGFRYEITSIGSDSSTWVFGLDYLLRYGQGCVDFVDEPSEPLAITTEWRVQPGLPQQDGPPILLRRETVTSGTYLVSESHPVNVGLVIDIPEGAVIRFIGVLRHNVDHATSHLHTVVLEDVSNGSIVHLDPVDGTEVERYSLSPSSSHTFDLITASVRLTTPE